MNTKTKTTFQFVFALMLFASFAVAGCNSEGDSKKVETKDSVTTEKSMEAPATQKPDSARAKDTGNTRPTPGGG